MTTPPRRAPRVALLALLAALLAALLLGCGDDASAGTGTDGGVASARLILDWYPNADHAGLLAAQARGFFRDAGVDVTTSVPSDPAAALTQVAAGRAPFALSYEADVLLARAKGLPVVAVGAVFGQPLNAVIARADRGITRPRDLEGQTVGVAGVPSDRPLLDAVIRGDGGDPAAVRVRVIGYTLVPALVAGKVDAVIGAYRNIEAPEIEAKGVAVRAFGVERYGVPPYDELVVVTSERVVRDRPELVRAFLSGLARGQGWAARNPAAAVPVVAAANRDLSRAVLPAQVRRTVPLLSTDVRPDPAAWVRYAAWMRANRLLGGRVDVREAVDPSFAPAG